MKRYRVTVDGRTYEVEIDDPRARPLTARVLGEVFRVDVEAEGRSATGETVAPATSAHAARPAAPSAAPATAGLAARQQQLTAPIPGKITKVIATPGQTVQRGDELVTIEAMKMFNMIRSPWAGTVVAVHTAEGKQVIQGELLVTFTLS